jgi:cell division cycle 20-like protein 1 (cofactor of APC complex)
MTGHSARVGALAWNDNILSSGSRDKFIYHRDTRSQEHYIKKIHGHKQEVCGLKWNEQEQQLASGGNDNKLFIWDRMNDKALLKFNEHSAAVKAIAWSPHSVNLLFLNIAGFIKFGRRNCRQKNTILEYYIGKCNSVY